MNAIAAFIIGLVVGWAVEWVIDWVYWRGKKSVVQPAEGLAECRSRVSELEQEIASYKSQLASLQAEAARTAPVEQPVERAIDVPARAAQPVTPDDLEVIVGIGPVIARTLNNAGINTFAQLAALSAEDLRSIVGKQIERLADEEKILAQARQLAERQNQGG